MLEFFMEKLLKLWHFFFLNADKSISVSFDEEQLAKIKKST
jgi:predicted DNA binding CopG/RHH family protein